MSSEERGGLRVVLDTNVYFSGFTTTSGPPFRLWQRAVNRRFRLLISPDIVRETAAVLRTVGLWNEAEVIRHLKLLARVAEMIMPKLRLEVVTDDPDDNRILECAVAGRADLIVSGDRHLRKLRSFQGIGIVRPIDFERTLGS